MFSSLGAAELIVITVVGCVAVAAGTWVARDARSRGMEPGVWVPVVLLLSWLGLIIYLVSRQPKTSPGTWRAG